MSLDLPDAPKTVPQKTVPEGTVPRKRDADYVFFELTRSICPECRRVLDAQVLLRDDKVYMRKRCPEHGTFEGLVYGDAKAYVRNSRYNKPGTIPLAYSAPIKGRVPPRLRAVPRPSATRVPRHHRGELGLQHGLPAVLRERRARLLAHGGGCRGDPRRSGRHRGHPRGRPVLGGRTLDQPGDRGDAPGGEGPPDPHRDDQHERQAPRRRPRLRPLPRRDGRERLPPVRRLRERDLPHDPGRARRLRLEGARPRQPRRVRREGHARPGGRAGREPARGRAHRRVRDRAPRRARGELPSPPSTPVATTPTTPCGG